MSRIPTIHLTKPAADFTVLPNALLRNQALSFKSRGILAFMMSHVSGWEAHAEWLSEQGREGREAIRSAIKELEEHGYAVHAVIRGDAGVIVKSVWTWHSEPVHETERSNRTRWRKGGEISKTYAPAETTASRLVAEDDHRNYGKPSGGLPSDGFPPVQKDHRQNNHSQKVHAPDGAIDLFNLDVSGGRPDIEAVIDDIYKAYPRHKMPKRARIAIRKALRDIDGKELLKRTETYASICASKGTAQDYIPYPATWFNGGGFKESEITNHDERTKQRRW